MTDELSGLTACVIITTYKHGATEEKPDFDTVRRSISMYVCMYVCDIAIRVAMRDTRKTSHTHHANGAQHYFKRRCREEHHQLRDDGGQTSLSTSICANR